MLSEYAPILAVSLKPCFVEESFQRKRLEQRRGSMAFAKNKTVPIWIARARRVDAQDIKVSSCEDVYTRKTGAQMRGASPVRSFDYPMP